MARITDNESLFPRTDPRVFSVGQKVLCFQPSPCLNPQDAFHISTTDSEGLRTEGWWFGFVLQTPPLTNRDDGWVMVGAYDPATSRNRTRWAYNGKEFPVYPIGAIPRFIREFFEGDPTLRAFLMQGMGATLEDEFFRRPQCEQTFVADSDVRAILTENALADLQDEAGLTEEPEEIQSQPRPQSDQNPRIHYDEEEDYDDDDDDDDTL